MPSNVHACVLGTFYGQRLRHTRAQEQPPPPCAALGAYDCTSIRSLTQEDPLGLAGGLNLYGFAAGDPVNFSDPFGLKAVTNIVYNVKGDELSRCGTDLENN